MDIVDRDMVEAEREATRRYSGAWEDREQERAKRRASQASQASQPIQREATRDSALSDTSSEDSDREGAMGRIATASGASIARSRTGHNHPVAMSRTQTHRLQHSATVGASLRTRTNEKPLPNFGGGKPFPPPLPPYEDYVVEYDGPDDPLHPQNWPFKKKLVVAGVLAYTSLCSTFTSSIFSASTQIVAKYFGVGVTVATLSTSLYVLGYAFGPLVWGPFSELKGRKLPILVAMFGFSVFNFASATAENLQTLMISRFFTGFFGSCPLAVVAAAFADMFDNTQRGVAVVVFSATVFLGPMLGPFIGGFIDLNKHMGWRFNLYIPGMMGSLALILNLFVMQETYAPIVLVSKAEELRRRTKNWGIHAKQEEVEVDFRELITKNFTRPLRLLVTEPIILLITIYMSFIYGLIYLFLTAYPLVFTGVHGFNAGVGGLPFFGMMVGIIIVASYIIYDARSYNKKLAANGGIPVPEWRLPPVMIGGVVFTIGLFWFGWTGYTKSIPWIVPTLSGLCTGFGLLAIFIQLFNYIIDSYLMFAASAIAANTFLRSITAAGFPLFARQMFNGLGIEWAATLLGCLAAVCIPIPVLFYFYGKKLRQRSKFAPTMKPKSPETDEAGESTTEFDEDEDLDGHDLPALHATRSRAYPEDDLGRVTTTVRTRSGPSVVKASGSDAHDLEKGKSAPAAATAEASGSQSGSQSGDKEKVHGKAL